MQYMVVGIFGAYGAAEDAVQDLEHVGIVGQQVELITDIDQDVRTQDTAGEPSTKPPEQSRSRIARIFGSAAKPDVRDESGEMPNYIGEQEFYANHVKQGGVVMVVRTATEQSAKQAADILGSRGARNPGQKSGPTIRRTA